MVKYTVVFYPTGDKRIIEQAVDEDRMNELIKAYPGAEVTKLKKPDWDRKKVQVELQDKRVVWVTLKPVYCRRCGGSGWHGPTTVYSGICFACNGAGFVHVREAK